MLEPSSIPNPGSNPNSSHKEPIKPGPDSSGLAPAEPVVRWRTEAEQRIYSSKLVDELGRLHRRDSADATARAIRDAADGVLASSAKGRTRWSRAMLNRRVALRLSRIKKKHKRASATRPEYWFKKPAVRKKPPRLQRKVRMLSRLVPGCRKLPLTNLLEEATDYIAALEMQVKAMALLTGLLNGAVPAGFLANADQYFSSTSF